MKLRERKRYTILFLLILSSGLLQFLSMAALAQKPTSQGAWEVFLAIEKRIKGREGNKFEGL